MTTYTSSTSVAGTRDIVNQYRQWDTTLLDKAPSLSNDSYEFCITVCPEQFGIKPRSQDSLNSPEGGFLLSSSLFSLLESCLTAHDNYTKSPYQAEIAKYHGEIKQGVRNLNGVEVNGNKKLENWEAWWNYLDPVILAMFCKFFGIWDSKEGMKKVEWVNMNGFDNSDQRRIVDERGNKKVIKSENRKLLHLKGAEWAYNPLMVNYIETDGNGSKTPYGNHIASDGSNFGLKPWINGKLTLYYIKHEKGFVYPVVYCENYYGQLFCVTGDPKFKVYMPVGFIVEIQSNSSVNWESELIKTKTNGKMTSTKGIPDVFELYTQKSGQLKIKAHVC